MGEAAEAAEEAEAAEAAVTEPQNTQPMQATKLEMEAPPVVRRPRGRPASPMMMEKLLLRLRA